jgi:hypothetical protein
MIGVSMVEIVRIVNPDGAVSPNCYEKSEEQPDKDRTKLIDINTKEEIKIHPERVVDKDSINKAVVIKSAKKTIAICPKCKYQGRPQQGKLTCPDCGVFELVSNQPSNVLKEVKKTIPHKENPKMDETTTTPEAPLQEAEAKAEEQPKVKAKTKPKAKPKTKSAPVQVNFEKLKEYGHLYTKKQIKFGFENAKTDVQAHSILAEGPLRKLSFNTYNGSLGKKSKDPAAELNLEAFKNFEEGQKLKQVSVYKHNDLSKEIKDLEDKGYEKQ